MRKVIGIAKDSPQMAEHHAFLRTQKLKNALSFHERQPQAFYDVWEQWHYGHSSIPEPQKAERNGYTFSLMPWPGLERYATKHTLDTHADTTQSARPHLD